MTVEVAIANLGSERFREPVSEFKALDFLRAHLAHLEPPYTTTLQGHPGTQAALPGTMDDLERLIGFKYVGDFIVVRSGDDGYKVRIVDAPPWYNTNGNWKVDRYATAARGKYPKCRNLGCTVCKSIGSTSTASQHTDWVKLPGGAWQPAHFPDQDGSAHGNAIDLALSNHDDMYEASRWTWNQRDTYDVHTVIFDLMVVSRTNPSWHEYVVPPGGSTHEGHWHVDFDPQRSGATLC